MTSVIEVLNGEINFCARLTCCVLSRILHPVRMKTAISEQILLKETQLLHVSLLLNCHKHLQILDFHCKSVR